MAWAPLEYDRQRNILSFRYNTPIAETKTPAWRSSLPRITAPTLVIHGTKDPVLSLRERRSNDEGDSGRQVGLD